MKSVILRVERNGGWGWEWVSGKTGIALAEAFIFFFTPTEAGDEYGAVDLEHADRERR